MTSLTRILSLCLPFCFTVGGTLRRNFYAIRVSSRPWFEGLCATIPPLSRMKMLPRMTVFSSRPAESPIEYRLVLSHTNTVEFCFVFYFFVIILLPTLRTIATARGIFQHTVVLSHAHACMPTTYPGLPDMSSNIRFPTLWATAPKCCYCSLAAVLLRTVT